MEEFIEEIEPCLVLLLSTVLQLGGHPQGRRRRIGALVEDKHLKRLGKQLRMVGELLDAGKESGEQQKSFPIQHK